MRLVDERMMAILAAGMLSSIVLLSAESHPPSLTVAELWALGEDSEVTVSGILVSLRSYDSGSETMVLSDGSGSCEVKVACTPGPGVAPSTQSSIGDILSVSGECVFRDETPTVFCRYGDVEVLMPCEEVLTVAVVCSSWEIYLGDIITMVGDCVMDQEGAPRLTDPEAGCSIAMVLGDNLVALNGRVSVRGQLEMDRATMSLVLIVTDIRATL